MARRGKFGRRRGGSTNLTALVAQLLKEQRAAEDRTMFDAWQNGGQVDGKPVTDDRLLSYIKGRRNGFSTDDPLWDEWDNRLTQYGFSIGESKIQLAFQQGRVGAGAVASFYRNQLKNIPKNSEFYRDVAGRAAQWAKSAGGGGGGARGRGRASATKGLRDQLNQLIYDGARYDQLEAALTAYARREGIITGDQKLTDASATALRSMFDRGIYSGDDQITFEDFRTAAVDKFKNLSKQVNIQVALGNQGITARNAKSKFLNETLVGLNTVDDRSQYEYVRNAWEEEVADANGNPYAIAAANEKYALALGRVRDNAGLIIDGYSQNSAEFIGAIGNEINALMTGTANGESVAEMFGATGDMASTASATASLTAAMKDIESGRAYYGQTEAGGPLGVNAFPPQTIGSPLGLDPSLQPSVTSINGVPQVVYLKGDVVKATSVFDASGELPVEGLSPDEIRAGVQNGTLTLKEGQNLGYVFVNPATGLTKYGIVDPASGTMVFTDTNPWGSDPFKNGETLNVLTGATQAGGKWIPNVAGAYVAGAPDLSLADPLISDSTVAPRDMLALLDAGIPGVNFQPEDVEAYKAKLLKRQQTEANATANRYKGQSYNTLGRMGELPNDPYAPGGGGDLRGSILSGMNSIANVTNQLFGSPDGKKDDLYVPPPPPPALAPMPPPALAPAPTLPTLAPKAPPPTTIEVEDRGEDGRGAGGSWGDDDAGRGAGGSWGTPEPGNYGNIA